MKLFANKRLTAPIAQLVEQIPLKDKVPGSSPGGGTNFEKNRQTLPFYFYVLKLLIEKNMLTSTEKIKTIKGFKLHETDTGSTEVQIALLSEEIKMLLLHLKKHPQDFHSKRGLLKMVAKRRKLLGQLKEENVRKYNSVVKKIGLKK